MPPHSKGPGWAAPGSRLLRPTHRRCRCTAAARACHATPAYLAADCSNNSFHSIVAVPTVAVRPARPPARPPYFSTDCSLQLPLTGAFMCAQEADKKAKEKAKREREAAKKEKVCGLTMRVPHCCRCRFRCYAGFTPEGLDTWHTSKQASKHGSF